MNVSPFCCIKTISVTVRSSSGAKLEQSKTCQNGPWAHSSHTSDNQYGDSGPAEEESSGRLRESGICRHPPEYGVDVKLGRRRKSHKVRAAISSRGLLRDCKTLRYIREGSFGALVEGEPPTCVWSAVVK